MNTWNQIDFLIKKSTGSKVQKDEMGNRKHFLLGRMIGKENKLM